ncbi:uncharacterized protein LOC144358008 [Saccoglossus kowalevskii]
MRTNKMLFTHLFTNIPGLRIVFTFMIGFAAGSILTNLMKCDAGGLLTKFQNAVPVPEKDTTRIMINQKSTQPTQILPSSNRDSNEETTNDITNGSKVLSSDLQLKNEGTQRTVKDNIDKLPNTD